MLLIFEKGDRIMAQLELVISPDGGKLTRVDLVEDYWTDFVFFRRDAWASDRNHDRSRTHRYLRAGLFAFLSYLNGLTNRWSGADSSSSAPSSNLADRLSELARRFNAAPPPMEELEFLKALSSLSFALQASDQADLFLALSLDQVDAAECKIAAWLDDFARAAGLPELAKMRDAGRRFIVSDSGGIEGNEDDLEIPIEGPNPFQDQADVWENAASEQTATRDGD